MNSEQWSERVIVEPSATQSFTTPYQFNHVNGTHILVRKGSGFSWPIQHRTNVFLYLQTKLY